MIDSLKRHLTSLNSFVKKRSFVILPSNATLPLAPISSTDRKFFLHWLFSKTSAPGPLIDIPHQDYPETIEILIDHLIHLHATVSICRIDEIPLAIKGCRLHLDKCRRSLKKDTQITFLQSLLDAIKLNYAPLFRRDFDLIHFLLWCNENGFIQQAYTIAADHLPLYLADKKLFHADTSIQQLCMTFHAQHTWAYNMLVSYNPNDALNYILLARFRHFTSCYTKKYPNQELSSFQFYELEAASSALKEAAQQIHLLPELQELKTTSHNTDWVKKYPIAAFLLDKLELTSPTIPPKLSIKKICQILSTLSNEETLDFFYPKRTIHAFPHTPVKKFAYCIDHELIFSPAPERAKSAIVDYFELKKIRNTINHAMPEQKTNLAAISKELQKRLQRIQSILANITPSNYQEHINVWQHLQKNTIKECEVACIYYDTFVLPLSAQRFAKKNKSRLKNFPTVILLIDPIWQPCVFLLCAAKPTQVAFLGLPAHLKHADKVLSYLNPPPISYEKISIHEDTIFSDISAALKLLQTLCPENFLIDVSRGNKLMALAVISASKDIEATVIYMETSFSDERSRPTPGGERFQHLL